MNVKTIVGPVRIERTAYGAAGQTSVHPLDGQAALGVGQKVVGGQRSAVHF